MRKAQAPGSQRPGSQAETPMAPPLPSGPTGPPPGSSVSILGGQSPKPRTQECGRPDPSAPPRGTVPQQGALKLKKAPLGRGPPGPLNKVRDRPEGPVPRLVWD